MPPGVFFAFEFRDSSVGQTKGARGVRVEDGKLRPLARRLSLRPRRLAQLALERCTHEVAQGRPALDRFDLGALQEFVGQIESSTHINILMPYCFPVKVTPC